MVNSGRRSAQNVGERSVSSRSAEREKEEPTTIKAADLDKAFDDGEDVSQYFDWDNARRPGLEPRRVNVDFPSWVVEGLDREAQRLGVTRQALIKLWIAERLEKAA